MSFGQGDGSTTFNVPDFRGRFLRGISDGQTTDPDRASRTAMATGGNTGDKIGSVQTDEFKSHAHIENSADTTGSASYYSAIRVQTDGGSFNWSNNTDVAGGNETRPTNAYIAYIIKY